MLYEVHVNKESVHFQKSQIPANGFDYRVSMINVRRKTFVYNFLK